MNSYRKVATRATHMFTTGIVESPREAWSKAAGDVFGVGTSSQEKSCPKDAFLALCEEGLVKGIPNGQYTRSKKNKKYALNAVDILKRNPDLVTDTKTLWNRSVGGEEKKHNSQMDVVIALWKNNLLVLDV